CTALVCCFVLIVVCFSLFYAVFFFFSSRRRHTRFSRDWSSDVCSSDLGRRRTLAGGLSRAAAIFRGGEPAALSQGGLRAAPGGRQSRTGRTQRDGVAAQPGAAAGRELDGTRTPLPGGAVARRRALGRARGARPAPEPAQPAASPGR